MSNFFDNVLNDANNVQQQLLGPDYSYWKKINSPSEIGMSSNGSIGALAKDVSGLVSYVELLVTGKGRANKTGQPLGNRFFLKTGATCSDVKTNNKVTRYVYINNVPTGNIPFISQGLDMNFSEFKGLIPGALSDMNGLNPFKIFSSFMTGTNPKCQELTMQTTPSSINNNKSQQTEFVTIDDIKGLDPCIFTLNGKRNPVSNKTCREALHNRFELLDKFTKQQEHGDDNIFRIYMLLVAILGFYIIYKVSKKK